MKSMKVEFHEVLLALLFADFLGASILAFVIFWLYAAPLGYLQAQLWEGLGGFAIAWSFSAFSQNLYSRDALSAPARRLLVRAMSTCAIAFGLILLLGFACNLSAGVSRIWFLTWAGSVFVWVGAIRLAWRGYLLRQVGHGRCLERALVFSGSPQAAARAADQVERESNGHIRVAGTAALPGTADAPTLAWVEDTVRHGHIDRVIVTDFSGAMAQTNALLARLTRVAVDVTLIPGLDGLQAPVLSVDQIGMLPAVDLDFRPLSPLQAALKRGEDLLAAGVLVLLLLPVLAIVALAVKLDSRGPVLFRQMRAGFNDRSFEVWKFRSMYAHARDDLALRQTSRRDARVTRVGRFLRCTSLDELPQLFNVLAGHMSIVGPRPHAHGMTAVGLPLHEVIEEYSARHRLKPGITGWAQVNGCRGEVDSHDKLRRRVALDCYYIENWSLGMDAWIIVRTAALVLFDQNAY
jgi:Undecaprenyl-phosphate glucose phosphotransferase